ncbi:MAG: vitamin K epoxide reductase family protein [Desulfomonilaceae bacterium]
MSTAAGPTESRAGASRKPNAPVLGAAIFLIFLAASLVGIFATGFLTYRHVLLAVESGAVAESPLCRASALVNCDAVLQTPEAVLFEYFPSSVVGLCGFVILFWLSAHGLFITRLRKIAFTGIVGYLCVAISFSAYFSYLMIFKEDFLCTWCIVVHVVNLAALSFGFAVMWRKKAELEARSAAAPAEGICVLTSALLAAVAVMAGAQWVEKSLVLQKVTHKYDELRDNPDVATAMIQASPTYDVPVDGADPAYGSPQATYPIVMFTDLQCPVCLRKELFLHAMVDINPEHLRLTLKNFPLSTDCNKKLSKNLHPSACEAARAAYAAFLMGGADEYWKYADLIFAHQSNLRTKPWFTFASQLGLEESKFRKLMEVNSAADKKVHQDIELGLKLGLDSTPAIFFLGKRIPEELSGLPFMVVIENLIRAHDPEKKDFTLRK